MVLLAWLLACGGAPLEEAEPGCVPVDEVCNDLDDDCDGAVDEEAVDALAWYRDGDGDGHGAGAAALACHGAPGWVAPGDDCDDSRASVYPGADEVCSGRDDDCDGEVDAGAVDAPSWRPDADGDGYGSAAAEAVESCEALSDHVELGGDCDDGDSTVHPGAAELCNGADDDCDASTGEERTALWVGEDGSTADWSALLGLGSWGDPVTRVLADPGTLQLCPGEWSASLRPRADLSVVGLGGADAVTLSGGGARGALIVREDGIHVEVRDITVRDGLGSGAVLGEWTAGGGIECEADATMTLSGVRLHRNEAGVGAGLYVRGCDVEMADSDIEDNSAGYYGGGVAVLGGSARLERVTVEGNTARLGGGLALVGYEGDASLDLVESLVTENEASWYGGAAAVEEATLTCEAAPSSVSGFLANTAGEAGGGVYLGPEGVLDAADCDFGEGAEDNDPDDVSSASGSLGDDLTITCDEEGCA